MEFIKEHGTVFKIMLGYESFYFIGDPKVIRFFLTDVKFIDKAGPYKFLRNWLGYGLLTSTGDKWRKRRKMITPTYHFNILSQFIDIFEANNDILIDELQKEVGKKSTDIYPYMGLCALDNICGKLILYMSYKLKQNVLFIETSMRISVNAQRDKNSDFSQSVTFMCFLNATRIIDKFYRFELFYKFTKLYRDEQKFLKIFHDYTIKVIRKRREEGGILNKEQKNDGQNQVRSKRRLAFLDLFLQATIDGEPLTDEDIREEVSTFLFGVSYDLSIFNTSTLH